MKYKSLLFSLLITVQTFDLVLKPIIFTNKVKLLWNIFKLSLVNCETVYLVKAYSNVVAYKNIFFKAV